MHIAGVYQIERGSVLRDAIINCDSGFDKFFPGLLYLGPMVGERAVQLSIPFRSHDFFALAAVTRECVNLQSFIRFVPSLALPLDACI